MADGSDITVNISLEELNSISYLPEYNCPFSTLKSQDCPDGYEFKWASLRILNDDPDIDTYNLLESQNLGWKAFIPNDEWRPDLARTKHGFIIYKGSLILSIREKPKLIENVYYLENHQHLIHLHKENIC